MAWCFFQGSWADGRRGGGQQSTAGRTAPNTSLEPTADAALIGMSAGSSNRVRSFVATVVAAVAQLYPLGGEALAPWTVLKRSAQIRAVADGQTVED